MIGVKLMNLDQIAEMVEKNVNSRLTKVKTIESTGNNNLILLQCITNYPSMIESANINVLKTYQNEFRNFHF